MNIGELNAIARGMVAKNRGLLAADESSSTIKKRFDTIKLESTEENRRSYREMLFTAPGAKDYISGVILYDETLRQSTKSGVPFPAYLAQQGMIPGIKVDLGAKPLAGYPGETMTEGLDGLRERFAEYHKLGARFAKWRAVINIDAAMPSRYAVSANAEGLARYAALAQEAGIVPIVEPEVLMDGAHSLERCEEVTNYVLDRVFSHLFSARVVLEGMILKPNMVIPGKKCADQATPERIAEATVRTLKRQVPAAVPGVAFLSGGQSPVDATLHLNLMHALGPLPWALTFSYGRALQEDALTAWAGTQAGFAAGQKALAKRAKLNGLAAVGQYSSGLESSAA
jgi:fructose-bisphosphate aldolase, class I